MPDLPSISRRQALAAAGLASTGVGGFLAGVRTAPQAPDWLDGRPCDPSALAASPMDWPFPRYDRANTGHAPAIAGPEWPPSRAWKREWPIGDLYRLRPLVAADGVIVGLLEAEPRSVVLGISSVDGHIRWELPVEDARYGHVCAAGGTAFIETSIPDSNVRFAARSLADGTALWTDTFASHVQQTLAGGRLITVDRSPDRSRDDKHFAVTAFDARTGVRCWRAVYNGWSGGVAVSSNRIVLPTNDNGILAIDPRSGARQWQSEADGGMAAIVGGRVISSRFPGELRAVWLADGSLDWEVRSTHFIDDGTDNEGRQYARPDFEVGAVTPTAIVYVLEVFSDYPRRLQARDPQTGKLLWDVGPEPEPVEFHGYSRPIAVGDEVLAVRYARRKTGEDPPDALLRLDLSTGRELGRVVFEADERVFQPIVVDGFLLVPTDERLIAYR